MTNSTVFAGTAKNVALPLSMGCSSSKSPLIASTVPPGIGFPRVNTWTSTCPTRQSSGFTLHAPEISEVARIAILPALLSRITMYDVATDLSAIVSGTLFVLKTWPLTGIFWGFDCNTQISRSASFGNCNSICAAKEVHAQETRNRRLILFKFVKLFLVIELIHIAQSFSE